MRKFVRKKLDARDYLPVANREKNFDIQKDDADIQPGDTLVLTEWSDGYYMDTTPLRRRVKYVLRPLDVPGGLEDGYCIVGW